MLVGLGGRGYDNNALVCALLALAARRPVQIINSREEDLIANPPGVPAHLWLRVGFMADGTISGKEIKVKSGRLSPWGSSGSHVAATDPKAARVDGRTHRR